MSHFARYAAVAVTFFSIGIASGCAALSPKDVQTGRDVLTLVDTSCVVLKEIIDSKVVNQVCATEQELLPFVKLILAGRARQGAKADAGVADSADSAKE